MARFLDCEFGLGHKFLWKSVIFTFSGMDYRSAKSLFGDFCKILTGLNQPKSLDGDLSNAFSIIFTR